MISIDFNLLSIYFQLISIDFNLLSIYFQFTFNWFQITFNLLSIYFQFTFNLLSIDFNLLSIDFNLLLIYFQFFSLKKVGAHNRVPSKQLYYWVTEPLMRYPLEKLSECCFLIRVFFRYLIIWKTLHFKVLTQIWLSKVKASALPKERWRKGFVFF